MGAQAAHQVVKIKLAQVIRAVAADHAGVRVQMVEALLPLLLDGAIQLLDLGVVWRQVTLLMVAQVVQHCALQVIPHHAEMRMVREVQGIPAGGSAGE